MSEVHLNLPDGMTWGFWIGGESMMPSNWPTTDGGTVIGVRYDNSSQAQQDAMTKAAKQFLESVESNQVVHGSDV